MFREISTKIALQFTSFVLLLLLINGAVFIAAEYGASRRQSHFRLNRDMHMMMERMGSGIARLPEEFPPMRKQRIRILDPRGMPIHQGELFSHIPFMLSGGFARVSIDNEQYTVFTQPLRRDAELVGYAQVADRQRFNRDDVLPHALIYLLISLAISVFTFFVGKFFARSSLQPAERMMERLEQFTQDASHELRTPLSALNSSLDLALRNGKFREGIISAKEDLKQVSVLVERLLELARLDQLMLHKEQVDLADLMEEAVMRYRPLAAQHGVVVEASIAPEVLVHGDPSLLRQIISNLFSNAIKFSKTDGGTIRVKLTKDALSVEDTGVGMSDDEAQHIFDRFYQAERSRSKGGFGLGLAIVKRIIDLHGWRVEVKSKQGKGTVFMVRFTRG